MIYDAFIFNNEFELLEIRLNELSKCKEPVTHILVEAAYTHTGNKKPLYFDENKLGFEDWPILSVIVEKFPEQINTPREREKFQRNMIKGVLKLLIPADDSIIILSDVDEIINHKILDALSLDKDFAALLLDKFGYYFNMLEERQSWDRARVFKYSYMNDKTPEEIRNSGYPQAIDNAGWHFSWLHNRAKEKLKSFSHYELDNIHNEEWLEKEVNFWNGVTLKNIPIDNSFPEYIVNNIGKFKHLIK